MKKIQRKLMFNECLDIRWKTAHFCILFSPSKMILFERKYQTFDTVFHHQMKHLEVRQKYSAARRIFNSLLGVSSGDETLHLMFDILLMKLCSSFGTRLGVQVRDFSACFGYFTKWDQTTSWHLEITSSVVFNLLEQ